MSWSAFNLLKSGSKPHWIFRFTVGTDVYHYTSAAHSVTTTVGIPTDDFAGTQVWEPLPISLGTIKRSNSANKNTVTIVLPRTNPVSATLLEEVGLLEVYIEVWQGFLGDPDTEYVTEFLGRPQQVKPTYSTVSLVCVDESSVLRNKGISRVIQAPCPYEIFSAGCGLDIATYEVAGNATDYTGKIVTHSTASSEADGYFLGGRIFYNGRQQTITKHEGAELTLAGGLTGLADAITASGPTAVVITPGCRKIVSYCTDVFNNVENHGGFPELLTSPYEGDGIL